MDVTLRDLRYFLALAKQQHLTRAAEELSVAPATLSEAIKRLEAATGLELFDRKGRSIMLSDDGRALLEHAGQVLAAAEKFDDAAVGRSAPGYEKLRIGVSAGYGAMWLHALQQTEIAIDIEIVVTGYEDPTAGLRDGSVHAGIIGGPTDIDHELDHLLLGSDPRVAIVAERHGMAQDHGTTLAEIDEIGWLDVPKGDGLWHRYWRGDLDRGGAPSKINRSCGNIQELQYGLMSGEGICTIPQSMVRLLVLEGVEFVPVSDLDPAPVRLAHRRDSPSSSALQQLSEPLCEIAAQELLPVAA